MEIKSIYISSFGKIKNYEMHFSTGINTVFENNGWGKSTLAVFIKSMFYGLNDGKRSVLENERTKFRPWNSTEKFGGNVVFTWKDKEYKIERFFGTKSSEDTVRLFEVQTGKEFSKTEFLGQRIFQIDEEGFLSTTYFSQKDLEVKSNSSLTLKYSTASQTENVEDFDKYLIKLENKAKEYKQSRGDKGLIPDLKREIFSINGKIEESKKAKETIENLKVQIEGAEKDVNILKMDVDNANARLVDNAKAQASLVKRDRLNNVEREIKEKNAEIEKLNQVLCGNRISEEQIKTCKTCVADLNKFEAIKQVLSNDLEDRKSEKIKNLNDKFNALLISAIIALCVGIGLLFVNIIVGALILALGLGLGVIAFFAKNKNSNENLSVASGRKEEYDKYSTLCAQSKELLDAYLSKFNTSSALDYSSKLSLLEQSDIKMNFALIALNNLNIERKNLLEDPDINREVSYSNESLLTRELENAKRLYETKLNELSILRSKLNNYVVLYDSFGDLENSKQLLEEKLCDYVRHYDVLTQTILFFKKADENMKAKYKKPLQEAFSKYYKEITGKENTQIDIDFNVLVDENGLSRSTDYYSLGYRNIFNICKRFALIDVLYGEEKPFIILDDPFVNFDEEKLVAVKNILLKLENYYQILYLTCHKSREINK